MMLHRFLLFSASQILILYYSILFYYSAWGFYQFLRAGEKPNITIFNNLQFIKSGSGPPMLPLPEAGKGAVEAERRCWLGRPEGWMWRCFADVVSGAFEPPVNQTEEK